MKIELNDVQLSRLRVAIICAVADAAVSCSRASREGDKEMLAAAQHDYDFLKSARDALFAAIQKAEAADDSFAPYQIVAVDDAGGPEGGKLMYYVQNEQGEAVSAKRFSYDEVAAQAQALANVRREHGVAVDELVAA